MKKDGMLQELTTNIVKTNKVNIKYGLLKLCLILTVIFTVALAIKYVEVSTEYRMYKQYANQCTTNDTIPLPPLEKLK